MTRIWLVAAALMLLVGAQAPDSAWLMPTARADFAQLAEATLPAKRSDIGAVWDGTAFLLFGGFSGSVHTDQIVRFDSATGAVTVLGGKLPSARTHAAAVWTGQHAFVFGGADSGWNNLDQVVRYDPVKDEAKVMGARLPSGRSTMSAVWDGKFAYVFGGTTGSGARTDEIVRYDPATDATSVMGARLPHRLDSASAVWTGSHAFIFGGAHDGTVSDEILRYDPATDGLAVMDERLPSQRRLAGAAWTGEAAYVFGGSAQDYLDEIVRYEPATGSVEVRHATLPGPRTSAAAAWDGHHVHVFGGILPGGERLVDIVRYDPFRPGPPKDLLALGGPGVGEITLQWRPDHPQEDGVTHYNVYRGTASGQHALVAQVGSEATSHTDRGLDLQTRYYYVLTSVSRGGESLPSNEGCSAPFPTALLPSLDPPCPLPPGWREQVLLAQSVTLRPLPGEGPLVVDGRPGPDPRFYVLTVSVAGRSMPAVSLFTGGLVQEPVHVEAPLPAVGPATATVRAAVRHDPAQEVCLLGVGTAVLGLGSVCAAPAPLDPLDGAWLAGAGPKAEAVLSLRLEAGGQAVLERWVRVPFVGQAAALAS